MDIRLPVTWISPATVGQTPAASLSLGITGAVRPTGFSPNAARG